MNKNLTNNRNLFNRFWRDDFFDNFFSPIISNQIFKDENYLNAELKEDKDNYYIKTELPGFEKDKIKIDFDNDKLIIQGEKSEEITDKKHHFSEISYGTFFRSFTLHKNVNEKETKAKYENGILSVIVPKLNKNETINISIE